MAVLAGEALRKEWMKKPVSESVEMLWCGSLKTLLATVADVYVDLEFDDDPERIAVLQQRSGYPILVNSVEYDSAVIGHSFIRINAWPGFLERSLVELAATDPLQEESIQRIFSALNWQYVLAPDIPGMISARIIATIINEAYFTFGDGISTREEIDIAMKAGTSYPFGPFEWAAKIGLASVANLLREMNRMDGRYALAPALEEELNRLMNES